MKVVISAGGTGGHIYPALAIINKIKKEEPNSDFLYIGSDDRMEKDIIPETDIKFIGIKIKGLKRKITLDNVKSLYYFLSSRIKCKKIIKEFDPDVVIGTGGYVTAPVIWAGKKLGKKTFIHEQNTVVGLANKYLSTYADKIGVSFENTLKEFNPEKVVLTGNPCSEKTLYVKKADKEKFDLSKDKKLVLIVMGSQGSSTVNEKIASYLMNFKNKDYEVLFITGSLFYDKLKKTITPPNVKIVPFVKDLASLMKSADLLVSRAGATTISEIEAVGIPTIFIPSPYVTENHQYKNAMDLVEKEAGLILEEKDLSKNKLISMIDGLFENSEEYQKIQKNLKKGVIKNSSSRIYEVLKDLIMCDKKFY